KGDGTFKTPAATNCSSLQMAAGDFNHDGKLDLAFPGGICLGNGNGTFGPLLSIDTSPEVPLSVAIGDFNADGNLDLAFGTQTSSVAGSGTAVLLGNGDGTFQAFVDYPDTSEQVASSPSATMVAADFNRDKAIDIASITDGL